MAETQQFPFVTLRNARGETLLRPQLPLNLSYNAKSLAVAGLLDTGADVNVLPYNMGVELGAIWEDQRTSLKLSGNLANYEARGLILSATVGKFSPVQLAFAWTRAENVPLLLGQVNFFSEFNICFFRSRSIFEISPKM